MNIKNDDKPVANTPEFRAAMRAEVKHDRAIANRATMILVILAPLIALACLYVVLSGVVAEWR